MENRQNVVADYLELRIMLNRTNPKSNQKTEIEFCIERKEEYIIFFATLQGIRNAKFLELCRQEKGENWKSYNYSGLIALENFCVKFLRANLAANEQPAQIKKIIAQLWQELRSLGIPK